MEAPSPSVLQIARLGMVVKRGFGQAMADETWAQDAGLRPGCFGVLRAISTAGSPPSQRELSESLGMDPSDVVGLVDVLEHAGYVERQRDPGDRRRYALTLTPAGIRAHDRFLEVAETNAAARALYGGLGMREVARYHYRVAPDAPAVPLPMRNR